MMFDEYPSASEGTVVVWGLLAREPYGGMAWQVLHYLEGLRRLGFDVWYVEDSDALPAHPHTRSRTLDPTENLKYLRRQLERVGLQDRWAYRRPTTREVIGPLDWAGLLSLYRRSEAVLNLCGSHEVRPHHLEARRLVYVETDPFFLQIRVARGDDDWLASQLDHHTSLFSYGLNLGTPLCDVPLGRFHWHRTRPPVVTDWWTSPGAHTIDAFTTIANLRHTIKDISWNGREWRWSKHGQFEPFRELPGRVSVGLEMALVNINDSELANLHQNGWRTRSGWALSDPSDYREFIRASMGEFSVAKEQYVLPRTGWTSDRSVCYLAAGRPVVLEDTGAGFRIPTGWGMLTFTDPDSAAAAIDRVCADYAVHAWAAAELAREYFEAETVLSELMNTTLHETPKLA